MPKADGDHISRAIISTLTERYGDEWQQKLIGMGTDGASVMMGSKTGVSSILGNTHKDHLYLLFTVLHTGKLKGFQFNYCFKCLHIKQVWSTFLAVQFNHPRENKSPGSNICFV